MRARFERAWAKASRANLAASVGFLLALSTSHSASAALATPEQRRACSRTSTGFVPAKSQMSAPSPIACGGRRRASANPAGQCSSSEGRDPERLAIP